jgi:PAS domain S-box-containing protein
MLALRWLIAPVIGNRAPYASFYLSAIFSAWFGGLGPGLLAVVLGGWCTVRFILSPDSSFLAASSEDQWSLAIYSAVALTLVWFSEALNKQQQRAEANAELAESRHREAARQRETLNLTLSSIGDAVIVTNAKGVVTRINAVAERLTGWPSAEAIGQTLTSIFVIVNESTREPVPNPAERAIREGTAVGLANHTILLSRSGEEIPIDDSAAPIRDAEGAIAGAVLIFRDVTRRRQAEAALARSERVFRTLADTAPVLIWMADTDAKRTYFNKPWLDFTGRSIEQESGNGWFESIHPDDSARCTSTYLSAAGKRELLEMEYRLRRFDGEYRWVFDRGVPRFTSDGAFEGYVGCCLDITDRKRAAEEALRFSWIVENTEDAILSKTLEGTILTWNKGAERVYGYTAAEAIGRSILFVIPPHRRAENEDVLAQVRRGEGISYETERQRSDGQIIRLAVTVSPVRNTEGEIVGMSTIARDISARVRAEEAVRESEQSLRLALKAARMGTWTNDVHQGVVRWSPELEEIFGIRGGTFGGTEQDFFNLIHPEDRERIAVDIRDAIERHGEYEIEFRYRRANGTAGWMSGRGRPFFDRDGTLLRLAGVAMDITERKRLEMELTQRTEELLRSNRDLEQFAYVSSHDLQEPLRTVHAYVQLLERRYKNNLDRDADDFIGFIVSGVQRMEEQIQALLDYSRVGSPGRSVASVDADRALNAALSNLEIAIRECGAVITRDPLPVVEANYFELGQVFQNLIGNAIKFRGDSAPHIHISAESQDGMWLFSVRDNGIGIDQQYGNQIFEIFKRLHGAEHDGTGIGLAICKKAIETHGGRIWMESQLGKGSTFYFTLRPASPVARVS